MHSIRRPQRYSCATAQPFLVVVKGTEYPIVKWTNLAFIAPNTCFVHLLNWYAFLSDPSPIIVLVIPSGPTHVFKNNAKTYEVILKMKLI